MKKLLLLSVLSFLAALPAAWASQEVSQNLCTPASKGILSEEVMMSRPDDCVTFGATLSCGIEVSVTACNVSTRQISTAVLAADVAICGGAEAIVIAF